MQNEEFIGQMTIDGHLVSIKKNETIIQVAERVALAKQIPRYCYHPALSVAGTCRMCMVEVEKAPKLLTSCSTLAAPGMVVWTQSDKVVEARKGVMEFLLVNHPLDCPVCDQAGECSLQNYNFDYGPMTSRFEEEKRVFDEKTTTYLSDKITLNMNRCIHCERCVRFEEEITKTFDLFMANRGFKKELSLSDEEEGLRSDYQGCLADICPVGALTFRDFRFKKRVWFLQKKPSLCDGCSKGCHIVVHSHKKVIYRYTPLYNPEVNGHFMCDQGRLSYQYRQSSERLTSPTYSWPETLHKLFESLQQAKRALLLIGTDATLEEAKLLKEELPHLLSHGEVLESFFYNGQAGVVTSADDTALDHLLKRRDLTPNTRGLESLGLTPFLPSSHKDRSYDTVIFFYNGRSSTTALQQVNVSGPLFLWGVWQAISLKQFSKVEAILPGLSTAEKGGTFVNGEGRVQHFSPAVERLGEVLSVEEIVSFLLKLKKEVTHE